MEKIELSIFAYESLGNLATLLLKKEYFSYIETADTNVQGIVDHIYDLDSYHTIKECKNDKYGKYYIKYKPPRSKTQYYIVFDLVDDVYYIQDIFADTSSEYARYIRGTK